ncbi:GNAT family N-acetyltransferase [Chloroflexota bacterium]
MIEIIKAEEKHVSAIGILWHEFIDFHIDIEPLFIPNDEAEEGFKEEIVRALMKSEDGLVLVALDKGQAVGYSIAGIEEPPRGSTRREYGCIHHMAVTESHRRTGIAEELFEKILKWLQSRGIDRIELDVMSKNSVSNSFWQKQGFAEFQRRLAREI